MSSLWAKIRFPTAPRTFMSPLPVRDWRFVAE